jgi:hypothetical protein
MTNFSFSDFHEYEAINGPARRRPWRGRMRVPFRRALLTVSQFPDTTVAFAATWRRGDPQVWA